MIGRVCLIRQSIYPLDLLARREAETLCQAGLETHVICLEKLEKDSGGRRKEIINGVHVHRLPVRRKKTNALRYVFEYFSFAFLASLLVTVLHIRHRFAVIQVNTMPDFLVFATILPKLLGAKVVSMMYEPTPELWEELYKSRPPRVLKLVEQAALAYVDTAFTVTQQLKDAYVARGANPEKIKVVLNAPEASFLQLDGERATELSVRKGFVLICHGTIEARYGLDTLLQAVKLIEPQIPNLRVRILGKGTYVDELLAKRKALSLQNRVDYLGYVPLAQLVQELWASDVGIVAQKSSPYANLVHTGKMYDYIAMGKPVLASRLKAVEAYFDQDAIRYFEAGDSQSLAEGILDLYNHPAKRESLARNAQRLYAEYRWQNQKNIYLSVYQRYLNCPSATPGKLEREA